MRRRALAVGRWLAALGVKLIVVACNTASAVALADLQRGLDVPVIGVIEPEVRAAVRATHNRRVGLMATEATVRSGSYPRMVGAHDAGVRVTSVACPGLAPVIQHGDALDDDVAAMVRRYTAPLTEAGVDTVILGCTHFPMIARLLRRSLPGATLIDGRSEIAREVADMLARKRLLRPAGPDGTRRFVCSARPRGVPPPRRTLPADAARRGGGGRPRAGGGLLGRRSGGHRAAAPRRRPVDPRGDQEGDEHRRVEEPDGPGDDRARCVARDG